MFLFFDFCLYFFVVGCPLNNNAISALMSMPNLVKLYMEPTPDLHLTEIPEMKTVIKFCIRLDKLDVSKPNFSMTVLNMIRKMPKLKLLVLKEELYDCSHIFDLVRQIVVFVMSQGKMVLMTLDNSMETMEMKLRIERKRNQEVGGFLSEFESLNIKVRTTKDRIELKEYLQTKLGRTTVIIEKS